MHGHHSPADIDMGYYPLTLIVTMFGLWFMSEHLRKKVKNF